MSQKTLEKRFGLSSVFIDPTVMDKMNPPTLFKEAIHVISSGYEDKTDWGKEVM